MYFSSTGSFRRDLHKNSHVGFTHSPLLGKCSPRLSTDLVWSTALRKLWVSSKEKHPQNDNKVVRTLESRSFYINSHLKWLQTFEVFVQIWKYPISWKLSKQVRKHREENVSKILEKDLELFLSLFSFYRFLCLCVMVLYVMPMQSGVCVVDVFVDVIWCVCVWQM